MNTETRKCKKCGKTKPLFDGFWQHNKGYRHECKDCMRDRMRTWERAHADRKRERGKRDYQRIKADPVLYERLKANKRVGNGNTYADRTRDWAYEAYGGAKCACCGETERMFLTLDHINNDGHKHRNAERLAATNLYNWVKARKYPPGFQVLCFNCNLGKARNKGVCPHKSRQEGPETIAQASTFK